MTEFEKYKRIQDCAKQAMAYCVSIVKVGVSLPQLRKAVEDYLLNIADSFWYHGIGAFIFSGESTIKSISGREYKTENYFIKDNDIITVDLSPQKNGYWGDFARTIIIENGLIKAEPSKIENKQWREGQYFLENLHQKLLDIACPDMLFSELFQIVNKLIEENGFVNLDFKKNLGHSIEKNKERIYIDENNLEKLSSVPFFTFEPHISKLNGSYGFKHEDIYYFDNGKVSIL